MASRRADSPVRALVLIASLVTGQVVAILHGVPVLVQLDTGPGVEPRTRVASHGRDGADGTRGAEVNLQRRALRPCYIEEGRVRLVRVKVRLRSQELRALAAGGQASELRLPQGGTFHRLCDVDADDGTLRDVHPAALERGLEQRARDALGRLGGKDRLQLRPVALDLVEVRAQLVLGCGDSGLPTRRQPDAVLCEQRRDRGPGVGLLEGVIHLDAIELERGESVGLGQPRRGLCAVRLVLVQIIVVPAPRKLAAKLGRRGMAITGGGVVAALPGGVTVEGNAPVGAVVALALDSGERLLCGEGGHVALCVLLVLVSACVAWQRLACCSRVCSRVLLACMLDDRVPSACEMKCLRNDRGWIMKGKVDI
eukprot:scaffold94025_cov63-Phaeocystis_antarctica.AAC.4